MVRNIVISTGAFLLSIAACEVMNQMQDDPAPVIKVSPEAAPPSSNDDDDDYYPDVSDDELVEV